MRYSVFTVVVLCLLLAGISSVVSQRGRGRLRGRPSRTIGCRYAGYHSCCRRGSCFVPKGNCYCDVKCHLYRDCCFDIFRISCGETDEYFLVVQFQLFLFFCVCVPQILVHTVCDGQWIIKLHLIHAGGCIAKGHRPWGGCCTKKWPPKACYSRPGRCWCDAACHFFRDCCEDIHLIGCSKSKKYSYSHEQFIATYSLQLDRHVLLLMFALWMDYHS